MPSVCESSRHRPGSFLLVIVHVGLDHDSLIVKVIVRLHVQVVFTG